jgi:hypothetical protein
VVKRPKIIEVGHTHTTPDLYFAAYLQCSGGKLTASLRNGPRCYFAFELTQPVASLRAAWHGGHGEVSAMLFAQTVKSLKAMAMSTV